MKNTLGELNNYLFEQIERLNDDELTGTALESQILKSTAINRLATTIIANAHVVLQAKKTYAEFMPSDSEMPVMLDGGQGNAEKAAD